MMQHSSSRILRAASAPVPSPGPTRPVDERGRALIGIQDLLEWTFATQCASLDYDEVGAALGIGLPSCGAEYRVGQQLALGKRRGEGVRPDTSFGKSRVHDDAEIVATVLRGAVSFGMAVHVAELARACRVPDWDLGPQRLQPRAWGKRNHLGQFGKVEVLETVTYRTRGRVRSRQVQWVPCVWVPSASKIAAARRGYLDWWGALLSVRGSLRSVELECFSLTDRMPPMTPWTENGLTQSSSY